MGDAVLAPADRPKRIVFGERYIGGDSDALCWREGIQRLCGLGFNALHSVPKSFIPVFAALNAYRVGDDHRSGITGPHRFG